MDWKNILKQDKPTAKSRMALLLRIVEESDNYDLTSEEYKEYAKIMDAMTRSVMKGGEEFANAKRDFDDFYMRVIAGQEDDLKKSNYYNYGIPSERDRAEMEHYAEVYAEDLKGLTENLISELQEVIKGKVTSVKLRRVFKRYGMEFDNYDIK